MGKYEKAAVRQKIFFIFYFNFKNMKRTGQANLIPVRGPNLNFVKCLVKLGSVNLNLNCGKSHYYTPKKIVS